MRLELKSIVMALVLSAHTVAAYSATENASTEPFDFSYRVAGTASFRPTLVFNDGEDTYIELSENVHVIGATSHRQGPYYVVRGLVPQIVLTARGEKIAITYEPRNRATGLSSDVAEKFAVAHGRTGGAIASAYPGGQVQKVNPPSPASESMPTAVTETKTAPADTRPGRATAAAVAPAVASARTAVEPNPAAAPAPAEVRPFATVEQPRSGQPPIHTPSCEASTVMSESSLMVQFGDGQVRLSADSESQLKAAVEQRQHAIKEVRVRMPDSAAAATLGKRRQQYLEDVFAGMGVPRSNVHPEYGLTLQGLTEVTFVNANSKPCGQSTTVVRMHDGLMTVHATDEDIATVIEQIAGAIGVAVRTEGRARAIPITVEAVAETPSKVLARVGGKLGDRADIVLRDKELVLRFH